MSFFSFERYRAKLSRLEILGRSLSQGFSSFDIIADLLKSTSVLETMNSEEINLETRNSEDAQALADSSVAVIHPQPVSLAISRLEFNLYCPEGCNAYQIISRRDDSVLKICAYLYVLRELIICSFGADGNEMGRK